MLFDASGECVTGGYDGEQLEWDRPAAANVTLAMRIGLVGQRAPGFNLSAHMRASTEPHQQQDFGFVYVLADGAAAASSVIAPQSAALAAFADALAPPPGGEEGEDASSPDWLEWLGAPPRGGGGREG